jgi:tetratricopeptide (TPR) repeat protein
MGLAINVRKWERAMNFSCCWMGTAYLVLTAGYQNQTVQGQEESNQQISEMSEAIRRNPKAPRAYINRGNMYLALQQYDKAAVDFTTAIQLAPKDPNGYRFRGDVYLLQGKYRRAVADYSEAIQLTSPNAYVSSFATLYSSRGLAYSDLREHRRAIDDLSQAIRLEPNSTENYMNRGTVFVHAKQYKQAIIDYSQAIKLSPNEPFAYSSRASCYLELKDYAHAIIDYREAIRCGPREPSNYIILGWLLATCPDAQLRKGKDAVEYATMCCSLTEWKSWSALDVLAAACAESGDFQSAVKWEREAIRLLGKPLEKDMKEMRERLQLYLQGKPYHEK